MKKKTIKKKAKAPNPWDETKAKALQSDKQIWVSVDGGKPINFYSVIKINSEPGVAHISHYAATGIRNLKIGEKWDGFHEATIKRVSKPRIKISIAKNVAGKAKRTFKQVAAKRKLKKKK